MLVCLDCGHIFNEPTHYSESHGFDFGSYEEWNGCPKCSGAYTKAYKCNCCGKWITNDYVKIEDKRYCELCYQVYELDEE